MKRLALSLALCAAPAAAQPIDLSQVTVVGSDPSALTFPRTARLESIGIVPGRMSIRTSGTDNWPGTDGTMDRDAQGGTLWVFLNINGRWHATGAERLRRYQVNGDKPVADPSQGGLGTLIGQGWLFDGGRWGIMAGRNPKPGERIGVMVVAGSTRSDFNVPLRARTDILVVTWPDAQGKMPFDVVWREGDGGDVQPPPPPPPPDDLRLKVTALEGEVLRWRAAFQGMHDAVSGTQAALGRLQDALPSDMAARLQRVEEAVTALQARPIVARCEAALSLFGMRIPISCRLVP